MWKRDQSVAPSSSPNADGTSVETVMDLGKSVVIKGELSGSEDLTPLRSNRGEHQAPFPHAYRRLRCGVQKETSFRAGCVASLLRHRGTLRGSISVETMSCRSPESDRRTRSIHSLIAGQDSSCWLRSSSRFDLSR